MTSQRSRARVLAFVPLFLLVLAPIVRAQGAPPPAPASPAAPPPAPSGPQPNIEIPESEFKTETSEGDPVDHVFRVKNSGKEPLVITDVKTSCGCTAAMLSKSGQPVEKGQSMTLAPGESGDIKTTFNSKGYSGEVKKVITVYSNDPDMPQATANLLVKVNQEITLSQQSLFFSGLLKDQKDSKSLDLTAASAAPLKITKAESDNAAFVPELKEVEPGKKYTLTVSTKPPLQEGSVTGKVTMETTNPKKPKVEVQVTAYVIAEITSSPNQVLFKGKTEKVKTIYVNGPYTRKDLKIEKIESDLKFLSMNLVPVIEGQTYRVEITLQDGAPEEFKGEIKVHNSTKGTPVLSVPVIGQKG
ncbi:MAG: DUF1573 domain-containing protein [Acidobacteriota bacterium]